MQFIQGRYAQTPDIGAGGEARPARRGADRLLGRPGDSSWPRAGGHDAARERDFVRSRNYGALDTR